MQGHAVLHDLLGDDEVAHVTVADSHAAALDELGTASARVTRRRVDAVDAGSVRALMREADVIIEALPGSFALPMARLAVECGVSLVSSMYLVPPGEENAARRAAMHEDLRELDATAQARGVTILSEFGLDPGLDLVLAVQALRDVDEVVEFRAYGAGIPAPDARDNPLHYRFSWSPIGTMHSYHRPARLILSGHEVAIPPEEVFEPRNVHRLDVPGLEATLECFPNGDAVHYAELFGIDDRVWEMGRYTGRLPGHCAFWDVMVKSGFLDERPVAIDGMDVRPLAFTATLLAAQEQYRYAPGDADMTFVRVDVCGRRNGRGVRVIHDLIDRRDMATGLTSMQRTVGFTLALGARLILAGRLPRAGLLTPLEVPYDAVFPALARRGIRVERRESTWP